MRAKIWRAFLRLRFLLWQRHRYGKLVLERGIEMPLVVLPGVFNPTLFRVTPVFLDYLRKHPPSETANVLDLGTGSGALALAAAESSMRVVAVDIDPEAVRCARINALLNNLHDRIDVRDGDLFEAVKGERFDLVLFNPPYYAGEPVSQQDRAFRAGDIPERLAKDLEDHLEPTGSALIVLSSDGDEATFLRCLEEAGFRTEIAHSKDLVSERVTLYRASIAGSRDRA